MTAPLGMKLERLTLRMGKRERVDYLDQQPHGLVDRQLPFANDPVTQRVHGGHAALAELALDPVGRAQGELQLVAQIHGANRFGGGENRRIYRGKPASDHGLDALGRTRGGPLIPLTERGPAASITGRWEDPPGL